jgi:hypothetical protein
MGQVANFLWFLQGMQAKIFWQRAAQPERMPR